MRYKKSEMLSGNNVCQSSYGYGNLALVTSFSNSHVNFGCLQGKVLLVFSHAQLIL